MYRLGEPGRGLLGHFSGSQILYGDKGILGDDPVRQFVLEVSTLVCNLRVKAGYPSPGLLASIGVALFVAQIMLGISELPLGLPIPAGILDLFSSGEGSEGLKAHVDADFCGGFRIDLSGNLVAREDDEPLADFSFESDSLNAAFNGSVETCADLAYVLNTELPAKKANSISVGREDNRVEAVASLETGVARNFSSFHPSEEGFKRPLESMKNALASRVIEEGEDFIGVTSVFELSRLVVVIERNLVELPSIPALFESSVVKMPCGVKKYHKGILLPLRGVKSIFESFTHFLLLAPCPSREIYISGRCEPHPCEDSIGVHSVCKQVWVSQSSYL
jgi:hypothetical protein